MKSDDNTAKTLTPEDAVRLDRAIASRPASPPRGYMVQGEIHGLEPEGGTELEKDLRVAILAENELARIILQRGERIRELEEDGRHQQARIRELEEWKRSRVDLEGRLNRLRPVVKFSVRAADVLIPGTAQGARLGDLARELDALTPADRAWAEGNS